MGKVHGSLNRAGKVKNSTPKVAKQEKPKQPRGRALKRLKYTKRFLTRTLKPGEKVKMNKQPPVRKKDGESEVLKAGTSLKEGYVILTIVNNNNNKKRKRHMAHVWMPFGRLSVSSTNFLTEFVKAKCALLPFFFFSQLLPFVLKFSFTDSLPAFFCVVVFSPPTYVENLLLLLFSKMGKVHGSLNRAGKVKNSTPKVAKQEKPKQPRGRALKRLKYTKRFLTRTLKPGEKVKMNKQPPGNNKQTKNNNNKNRTVEPNELQEEFSIFLFVMFLCMLQRGHPNSSFLSVGEKLAIQAHTFLVRHLPFSPSPLFGATFILSLAAVDHFVFSFFETTKRREKNNPPSSTLSYYRKELTFSRTHDTNTAENNSSTKHRSLSLQHLYL
eukprot:gene11715-8060_t